MSRWCSLFYSISRGLHISNFYLNVKKTTVSTINTYVLPLLLKKLVQRGQCCDETTHSSFIISLINSPLLCQKSTDCSPLAFLLSRSGFLRFFLIQNISVNRMLFWNHWLRKNKFIKNIPNASVKSVRIGKERIWTGQGPIMCKLTIKNKKNIFLLFSEQTAYFYCY